MMRTLKFVLIFCAGIITCSLLFGLTANGAELTSSPIPFKHDSTAAESSFTRFFASTTVCLFVLAGILYFFRNKLKKNNLFDVEKSKLNVIESRRLNAKSTLYVVNFADTQYLLAHSEQGLNCIASAPINKIKTEQPK